MALDDMAALAFALDLIIETFSFSKRLPHLHFSIPFPAGIPGNQ